MPGPEEVQPNGQGGFEAASALQQALQEAAEAHRDILQHEVDSLDSRRDPGVEPARGNFLFARYKPETEEPSPNGHSSNGHKESKPIAAEEPKPALESEQFHYDKLYPRANHPSSRRQGEEGRVTNSEAWRLAAEEVKLHEEAAKPYREAELGAERSLKAADRLRRSDHAQAGELLRAKARAKLADLRDQSTVVSKRVSVEFNSEQDRVNQKIADNISKVSEAEEIVQSGNEKALAVDLIDPNWDVINSERRALGRSNEPFYVRKVGGKSKDIEYYFTTTDPSVVMVERVSLRAGRLTGMGAVVAREAVTVGRKGRQRPSKEVMQLSALVNFWAPHRAADQPKVPRREQVQYAVNNLGSGSAAVYESLVPRRKRKGPDWMSRLINR